MKRFLTKTATTKRAPAMTGGKRGEPALYLAGIECTPLDPVDGETARRLELRTPYSTKETFVDASLDIKTGDTLTVDGADYIIRYVEPWEWRDSRYLHLVVEVPE